MSHLQLLVLLVILISFFSFICLNLSDNLKGHQRQRHLSNQNSSWGHKSTYIISCVQLKSQNQFNHHTHTHRARVYAALLILRLTQTVKNQNTFPNKKKYCSKYSNVYNFYTVKIYVDYTAHNEILWGAVDGRVPGPTPGVTSALLASAEQPSPSPSLLWLAVLWPLLQWNIKNFF